MSKLIYRVEVSSQGCATCGTGTQWAIVTDINGEPTEIGGTTWGDKEVTEDLCDMLNEAYMRGSSARKIIEDAVAVALASLKSGEVAK